MALGIIAARCWFNRYTEATIAYSLEIEEMRCWRMPHGHVTALLHLQEFLLHL